MPVPDVGQSGRLQSESTIVMIYHDNCIGLRCWMLVDELGIPTDHDRDVQAPNNGPHMNSWPDAGMTPSAREDLQLGRAYRGYRGMVRWPGHIEPGALSRIVQAISTGCPRCWAAAGNRTSSRSCLKRVHGEAARPSRWHLDGYKHVGLLGPAKTDTSPRVDYLLLL